MSMVDVLRLKRTDAPKPGAGTSKPENLEGFKGRHANDYDATINAMAAKYGVPPRLIKSVIAAESSFNPKIVSPAGAGGLMQLMPGTAHDLGVHDVFNAEQNIEGGTKYLASLLNRYHGDVTKAVAAYNAGPGAVNKYGGVPPYAETQNYVQKVLGAYNGSGTVDLGRIENSVGSKGVSGAARAPGGYMYAPPAKTENYTPMMPVMGDDLDELLDQLEALLAKMGIHVPKKQLLHALIRANPELKGIEKLDKAAQRELLQQEGGVFIPPQGKFPDRFGVDAAHERRRPDNVGAPLSDADRARFDGARDNALFWARILQRDQSALAESLGLPPHAPVGEIQAKLTDEKRIAKARELGLPDNASLAQIVHKIQDPQRASIAKGLGLPPEANWEQISAKEAELRARPH